jgi:hypothetical protein
MTATGLTAARTIRSSPITVRASSAIRRIVDRFGLNEQKAAFRGGFSFAKRARNRQLALIDTPLISRRR